MAFCCQIRLIFLFRHMKKEVNELLAPESRIPAFGPSWLRARVIELHREYYPGSGLRKTLYIYWWAMLGAFISAVAMLVRFQ